MTLMFSSCPPNRCLAHKPWGDAYQVPRHFCYLEAAEVAVRERALARLQEFADIAEDMLAGRQWLFDRFSIANIYLFWCLRRIEPLEIVIDAHPRCSAFFERLGARECIRRTLEFEAATLAALPG